jgi:ubiquitin C-terminal hydrolase
LQRDATKVLALQSLPPVLVLSLSRFALGVKRHEVVAFPTDLDIPSAFRVDRGAPGSYVLTAVVEHRGVSLHSGHYVTYAKTGDGPGGGWVLFDDGVVSSV